jgi:hypothetical protein
VVEEEAYIGIRIRMGHPNQAACDLPVAGDGDDRVGVFFDRRTQVKSRRIERHWVREAGAADSA